MMQIIKYNSFYFFLVIIFFCSIPQTTWASAVPVEKNAPIQNNNIKKRTKIKQLEQKEIKLRFQQLKKEHKTQKDNSVYWLVALLISWYVIAIAMLIIGLVLLISPLWIVAIIMLVLPLVAVPVVFAIAFHDR